MGYKYRNDGTPDHVNSEDSNSVPTPQLAARDTTGIRPNPKKDMSDSLDNDETRMKMSSDAGDKANAVKIGKRADQTASKYLVDMAKADSTKAAKAPAQAREYAKTGGLGEVSTSHESDAKKSMSDLQKRTLQRRNSPE